jgi:hypothetical protein
MQTTMAPSVMLNFTVLQELVRFDAPFAGCLPLSLLLATILKQCFETAILQMQTQASSLVS